MAILHNIIFQLDNPILTRLLTEQLSGLKGYSFDPNSPPDCIITHQGHSADVDPSACILHLPKGTIRLGEVLDRLHYVLSGREAHIEDESTSLAFGDFVLFPADNLLVFTPQNADIRLTDKERLLVRVLYEAGQQGLARRDLLKAVWGYADEAETHTLETHIYRLRQKLEPYNSQNIIKAIDGFYVLDIKKPA